MNLKKMEICFAGIASRYDNLVNNTRRAKPNFRKTKGYLG